MDLRSDPKQYRSQELIIKTLNSENVDMKKGKKVDRDVEVANKKEKGRWVGFVRCILS